MTGDRLRIVPYQHFLRPLVENFDCGPEPFAAAVATYIRSGDPSFGALYDLARTDDRAAIWLYGNADGELVGFSSYGTMLWPTGEGPRRVHHVRAIGLDHRFRRMPKGPRDGRYSHQMLDHLIRWSRSRQEDAIAPAIALFVHPENIAMKKLVASFGFQPYPRTYTDPASGVTHEAMTLDLTRA